MSARDDYPLHRALEMLNDCPSALDEIDRQRAERGHFREHSMMLNRVAWEIHQAMGVIPKGATSHHGPIITDELPRICELIRKGLEVERG